jgi:hypothetical protein
MHRDRRRCGVHNLADTSAGYYTSGIYHGLRWRDGCTERILETNAREATEDGKSLALMTMIRGSERYQLELNSEIYAFKAMTLAPPVEFMPAQVAQALQLKRDVFGRTGAIATEFQSGQNRFVTTVPSGAARGPLGRYRNLLGQR